MKELIEQFQELLEKLKKACDEQDSAQENSVGGGGQGGDPTGGG